MALKHRYLGERTEVGAIATWNLPNGKSFEAPVTSTTYSIKENDCKHCGKPYEIKGVFGGIREIRFEDTCPDCEHLEPDPNVEAG